MRLRAAVLALVVIAPMTAATPAHATATTSACTSASMVADFPSPKVPGDTVTFDLPLVAPATPGSASLVWRVVHVLRWFGESTPKRSLQVAP